MHTVMREVRAVAVNSMPPGNGQPSAPGSPPNVQTGSLRASIDYTVQRVPAGVEGLLSSSSPYAQFLEFGTRKMAARPFMRPALAAASGQINRLLGGKAVIWV